MPRTMTGNAPMIPLALHQAPGSRLGKMPAPTIPNKPLWYGARWHTQDPRPLPWKVQSRCRRDAALTDAADDDVVVILYVAHYLVTVTAREHGGEQRECRLLLLWLGAEASE